MLNPFDKKMGEASPVPPCSENGPMGTPPMLSRAEKGYPPEHLEAPNGTPHELKPYPPKGHGGMVSLSRGGVETSNQAHGGYPLKPSEVWGGWGYSPNLNQGGPVSEAKICQGVWLTEPPFAEQIRSHYNALVIQAKLNAGAKKNYHTTPLKPSRNNPRPEEPTFDLVGGVLSADDWYRIDATYLEHLHGMHDECRAAGLEREASWLRSTARRRRDEMVAAMLPEIKELIARFGKAEDRFQQPFASREIEQAAGVALTRIVDRIALLVDRVHALGSKAADEVWPTDSETSEQGGDLAA